MGVQHTRPDQLLPDADAQVTVDLVLHVPETLSAFFAYAVVHNDRDAETAVVAAHRDAVAEARACLDREGAWGLVGLGPRPVEVQIDEAIAGERFAEPERRRELGEAIVRQRRSAAVAEPGYGLETVEQLDHVSAAESGAPLVHSHLLVGGSVETTAGRRPLATARLESAGRLAATVYSGVYEETLSARLGLRFERSEVTGRREVIGISLGAFPAGSCQPRPAVAQRWLVSP